MNRTIGVVGLDYFGTDTAEHLARHAIQVIGTNPNPENIGLLDGLERRPRMKEFVGSPRL